MDKRFDSLQLYLYGERWTDPCLTDPWEMDDTLLHVSLPLDMEANEKSP